MSSKKSLTPQIRFKGFTEAWEQCELKDLFTYGGSGGTPSSNNRDYYNGNIPFLNISDLKERNIRFTEKQITTLGLHNSAAWIVPAGSISLAMYASVGKVGIICNDTATSQAFYNMVIQDILVRNFLYTRLEKADICNEWEPYISTGTQRNLNAEKVRNFKINIPSKHEMNQIGSIFEVLDSLITLHQRKLDALKKTKSSLLEKMFPKDGSNIPEIRFTGFTEAWEQRKLSELTTMHARIGWQNLRTSEFLDSGNYYLITGTDFENGYVNLSTCHYVNKDRYDQDPNIQIDNGSILITKDGTLGKVALVQGLDKPATLNAGVFNVVIRNEEIVDNGYLYQYLKAPFLLNYVAQTATGGTIKHLNQSILVDFPVSMPSKGEQKLIGDAFLRLDNLITLHQRKLDALKKIKSALLEKMFV